MSLLLIAARFGVVVESAEEDPSAQLCLGCPETWMKLGERCYKFFGSPKTWDDANSVCHQLNAELPSIHSYPESDSLYQLWKTLVPDPTIHLEVSAMKMTFAVLF